MLRRGGGMSDEIKAALKGRVPLIYARVSTKKQENKGALTNQITEVKGALKELGIKREPLVFSDVASGSYPSGTGKNERSGLKRLIEEAMKKPKKSVIVVRDTQRFARNPWLAGFEYWPLAIQGVPMISTLEGQVTPSQSGDLLMPILTAVGFQEIALRSEQTKSGMAASSAWDGNLLDLYSGEPLNPYEELKRLMPFWPPKGTKARADRGELGVGTVADRLGKTNGWAYDARDRIHRIIDAGGEALWVEWIDAVNRLRKMEAEHGLGIKRGSKKPTKAMKAVRRATGGFIAEPWNEKYAKATPDLIELAFMSPDLFKTAKELKKRL
jgi:hypothetical protein